MFPLRPGLKGPAIRDWEHEATTDLERIRSLWAVRLRRDESHVPEPCNVGIACGPSGLAVLDLDLAKPGQDHRTRWPERWRDRDVSSGAEVLAVLAEQVGQSVPETYVVATPSGGRHLYFTAPDQLPIRNSTSRLGPMIDVRGSGGYVVAAGSRLHPPPDGDGPAEIVEPAYRLVKDVPPAEPPSWLIDAIAGSRQRNDQGAARPSAGTTRGKSQNSTGARYGAAALRGESNRVRSAPVGQRNHTLNSAAYSLGQLVAAGALERAGAVQALSDAAVDAGLNAAETASTIESGLSAGLQQPRAMPERRSTPERSAAAETRDRTGARQEGPPNEPDPPKAETPPAEPPRNTPHPHLVLDAAIEQASAAVAQLEATRAGARSQSNTTASDVAVHNDRRAYSAESKVGR